MTTARSMSIAAVLALVCAGAASAQTPREEPPAQRGRGAPAAEAGTDVKPAALANALDQYAIVQAKRMLQLDDSAYDRFVPRFRGLQQARRRNQQTRNRMLQDLRRLAGPRAAGETDEATLRERLNALRDHDERAARELRAAHDAVDEVLNVRQQARFRIFEENIEARKLELLMRARRRAGSPDGR
jgi:hypothetical protein